jgi:hypothetical protein
MVVLKYKNFLVSIHKVLMGQLTCVIKNLEMEPESQGGRDSPKRQVANTGLLI